MCSLANWCLGWSVSTHKHEECGRWDACFGTVTRLWTWRLRNSCLIPLFSTVSTQTPCTVCRGLYSCGSHMWDIEFTTHLLVRKVSHLTCTHIHTLTAWCLIMCMANFMMMIIIIKLTCDWASCWPNLTCLEVSLTVSPCYFCLLVCAFLILLCNLLRGILFKCCNQFLLFSCIFTKTCVMCSSFTISVFIV